MRPCTLREKLERDLVQRQPELVLRNVSQATNVRGSLNQGPNICGSVQASMMLMGAFGSAFWARGALDLTVRSAVAFTDGAGGHELSAGSGSSTGCAACSEARYSAMVIDGAASPPASWNIIGTSWLNKG